MKKKMIRTMLAMVLVLTSICITTSAKDGGWKNMTYGEYILKCYISCTSSTGVAKTNGSMTDNQSRAAINIYNSKGVCIGNNTVVAKVPYIASASATKTGKVYKATSYHSLVRELDGTNVLPLYQQAVRNITK